jgi:hypothetical protein
MKVRHIVQSSFIAILIAALGFQTILPVQAGNYLVSPRNLLLANIVWVDDNYTIGGSNDGHEWGVTAFATIQGGVNAVNPGGTVNVAPGSYPEEIIITQSITLHGDPGDATPGPGPNAPTIGGCPVGVSYCNGIGFGAAVSNVVIEGFIIRDHPRDYGYPGATNIGGFGIFIKNVYTTPMANITVQDNLFIDNFWEALMFFSAGDNSAMYYENVSALNNRVENTNYFLPNVPWVGIECTNCRNSLIQGNVIDGMVRRGIWIASESTSSNPGFTNGMGVVVTGNTVIGATETGIAIDAFDTIWGTGGQPVLTGVTVSNNTFNRTSSIGTQSKNLIFLQPHHSGTVNDITITGNQLDHSYAEYSAINVDGADGITITGNSIHGTGHMLSDEAEIKLASAALTNTVTSNQITLTVGGYSSTNGILLTGPDSGNFTVSGNSMSAVSDEIRHYGLAAISLSSLFSGTTGNFVDIKNNRMDGFTYGLKFENTSDLHQLTITTNAMVNNFGGVSSNLISSLPLENNWWGCNAGPGQAGCDTYSGLVDADPWLVLTFSPGVTSLAPSADLPLASHLLTNSNSQDVSGLGINIPNMQSAFTSSLGSFNPVSAGFVAGSASSIYTAPAAPGIASLCAQVDNQQVCNGLFIANQLVFLPAVLR